MRFSNVSMICALACAAFVCACDRIFGPGDADRVGVTAKVGDMAIDPDSTGWPRALCSFALSAVAGKAEATWESATFRWYTGLDRSKVSDSANVSADDLANAFGASAVEAGQTREGGFSVWGNLPYELEMSFRYQTKGGSRTTTTARKACGPTPPSNKVNAPTLLQPTLTMPFPLQPGDSLVVGIGARSASALWATVIDASGAFAKTWSYAEGMRPASDRSAKLRVPRTTHLGSVAELDIYAVDIFGQTKADLVMTTPIRDVTAPTISAQLRGRPGAGQYESALGGARFVGDTLEFFVNARDNNLLQSVTWQTSTGDVRDSAIVADSALTAFRPRLLVRPEWAPGVQITFTARDFAGGTSQAVLSSAPDLQVIPTVIRPFRSVDITGGQLQFALVDTSRNVAYLLQTQPSFASWVIELSLQNMSVTRTIPLGEVAWGMDLSLTGDSLIVAFPAHTALGVINLRQSTARVDMIPLPALNAAGGGAPTYAAVTARGTVLVALNKLSPLTRSLFEVNLGTGAQRFRDDAATAGALYGLSRSHDHSSVILATDQCMRSYNATTDAFGACRSLNPGGPPAIDRTGQRAVVGVDVYDGSLSRISRIDALTALGSSSNAGKPWNGAVSPDGAYAYHYVDLEGVVRSRTSDGQILDRSVSPFGPEASVTSDGKQLLLIHNTGFSARVTVVDLSGTSALMAATSPALRQEARGFASPVPQRPSRNPPPFARTRGAVKPVRPR